MSETKCDKPTEVQKSPEEDAELQDLLDSAFKDLTSSAASGSTKNGISSMSDTTSNSSGTEDATSDVKGETSQNIPFKQIEEDMKKFTEALGSTLKCDNNEFDKFLQDPQKMEQMFQDAIKNIADVGNDDVQKLIGDLNKSGLNLDDQPSDPNINESMPQIFNLVQNLLSKELLYPALRDLSPKFEEWMANNKDKLSEEDKERYTGQVNLIKQICQTFEDDTLEDQQRFERNLDLMDKMQSLGAPPAELSVPSDLDNLMMDSMKDKCNIM